MGMYDSVFGDCPECRASVEFQSKAGNCTLHEYELSSIPTDIAADLDGDIETCKHCGCVCSIHLGAPIVSIPMYIKAGGTGK